MIGRGGASEARVLSYGKNKLRWHVACSTISGAFVNPLRLSCLKLLQLDSSDFIAQAITWPMRFEVIPGYGFRRRASANLRALSAFISPLVFFWLQVVERLPGVL